jgi:predicted GH43/DUF377 family glycosyl hydrolase
MGSANPSVDMREDPRLMTHVTWHSTVRRLRSRPIVEADSIAGYGPVFNAGLLHHDGRFHLFARAVRDGYRRNSGPGPRFVDYVSDIVILTSEDGHDYRFSHVLARAGEHGVSCFEDPRVQIVEHDGVSAVVMTYTNLPAPESGLPWRIGAHRLVYSGGRFNIDARSGRLLGPDGVENKDAVVFNLSDGRVALIHRVHPNMQLAVFDDLDHLWNAGTEYWDAHMEDLEVHTIIRPSLGALGVGAGAPPIVTDDGLLLFFHERDGTGTYTARLAVLDPHTGKVTRHFDDPVLRPELAWERVGDVDEVVFVQGAHRLDEQTVYLTYGAADRCVGAATVSIPHLLSACAAADITEISPRNAVAKPLAMSSVAT